MQTEIKDNSKTKCVDLKNHKVRDFHERGEFKVCYYPSTETLADIFTKALGPTLFSQVSRAVERCAVGAGHWRWQCRRSRYLAS
jgi:hypothetical protein